MMHRNPIHSSSWLAVVCAMGSALGGCGPDESGPCKDTFVAGDLVITEVFADYAAPTGGTGTDEGKEWFEIYNNSDRPLSLRGLTILHGRPEPGTEPLGTHSMTDVTIAPGQYLTLGNSTSDLVPPYVDYGYSADLGAMFNSDGGKLTLKCGDMEIDSAIYDTVKSGHSRQLTNLGPPDYTLNDNQANWCEANDSEFEANNFGTPGQDNDCTPVVEGACSDGGTMRAVVSPGPGDLVITEAMPQPTKVSDASGEWFEVKARVDVDLNGLAVDRAGDTANPTVVSSPSCIHVAAGSYAVLAHSLDSSVNGGITNAVGTFGAALVNGSTTAPGDIQVLAGGSVVDAISWTSSTSGAAVQLDPDFTDANSNNEPTNFCAATASYGAGDLGTPGVDNGQCSLQPPTGMCDGGAGLRPIVPPPANSLVITEIMPNPKIEPAQEWFEITNVGGASFDLNGLGLDRQNDSRAPDVVNSAACKPLAPGGFALFARSSDPGMNAMLPPPDATFGFSMVNSSGEVQVVDPVTCSGTPLVCTTIYDSVPWSTSKDTVSSQLKPGMFTTTANDLPANFCAAISSYGDMTNKGTPRAANACM